MGLTGGVDHLDLDLATAAVLARDEDQPLLLKMLADQLRTSLGERVEVQRAGGLFRRSDEVRSIEVALGADAFRAEVAKGRVECSIAHTSGGIRIRSDRCGLDEWIRRLLAALQAEAAHSQQVRTALERIVYGGA